jgi:hypothetical protein
MVDSDDTVPRDHDRCQRQRRRAPDAARQEEAASAVISVERTTAPSRFASSPKRTQAPLCGGLVELVDGVDAVAESCTPQRSTGSSP